ncbi:MAG: germination protein YpeB [Bacillota bacterium]
MKNEEKNTKGKSEVTKEKSKITSNMDEIGFDDKRTETTKVVKKSTPKKPSEKTSEKAETKTVTKQVNKEKEEPPKTKKQLKAEQKYQRKLIREEKRQEKAEKRDKEKIQKIKEREERKELKKDKVAYAKTRQKEKAEKAEERAEKATKRKEKFIQKRENFKGRMADKKEERTERKLEKHEDKIRRAGMTKDEKRAEKDAIKREKHALKSQKRAEKTRRKAEKAHAIAELKSQGIKVGSSKGLVAAVIAVSIVGGVALLSSIALAGTNVMYMREIDRTYMQSYYDVMQSANNLSASLAKSSVSSGTSGLVSTFSKASSDAFLAEHSLENIPSKDRDLLALTKFFNQAGELSKTMAQKVANGEEISEEEKALLAKVEKTATTVKEQINKAYASSMHGERKMHAVSNMFKGEIVSDVTENIKQLSNSTIEYPTMIFDGPFSDNQNTAAKRVSMENSEKSEITADKAMEIVKENLRAENVEYVTETNAPSISTHDFKFTKYGVEVYVQVDKECGKIVMLDADKRVSETKISESSAAAKAEEFLSLAGLENMVKVWSETSGNVTTFNYAKFENGAVIYPQLAKVKVALSDGAVLGFEGYSYITNKAERSEKPVLSLSEAREKVSSNLNIQTEKLVVIPLGSSEKLCYEFKGEKNGQTYFVYINAKTGNQAEIFMVVENPARGNQVI